MRVQRQGGHWACRVASRSSAWPWRWPPRWRSVSPAHPKLSLRGPARSRCPAIRAPFPPERHWSGRPRQRPRSRSPSRSSLAIPPRWRRRCSAVSDPRLARVPPLLDAGSSSRRVSGRSPGTRRAGHGCTPQHEGLTVGTPSATGLSLPVSGTVAQIQSAFSTPIEVPPGFGQDGVRQRVGPEVPMLGGAADPGHPRTRHPEPTQPSTSDSPGEPGRPHAPSDLAAPALAPGSRRRPGRCNHSINNVPERTGALDAVQPGAGVLVRPPLFRRATTGRERRSPCSRCPVPGTRSSDIATFAACYGITLGEARSRDTVGGGAATGAGTAEAELDIETVLSLAPKANIEVYEGGPSDSLYDVFSQIVSDDTAKIVSASWTNGCEAYVGQSSRPRRTRSSRRRPPKGSRSSWPRVTRVRRAATSTGRSTRQRAPIRWPRPSTPRRAPCTSPTSRATRSAWTAREARQPVRTSPRRARSRPGRAPDAVALDASVGKVFVANAGAARSPCSRPAPATRPRPVGCGSPTQIRLGWPSQRPTALAVNGSTLYVGNSNGTVAVYNASTNACTTATVTLPSSSVPTASAVDPTNGFVYVADRQ